MTYLLGGLSGVGTAAMLWVGGGVGVQSFLVIDHQLQDLIVRLNATGFLAWLVEAAVSLIFAIFMGFLTVQVVQFFSKKFQKKGESL